MSITPKKLCIYDGIPSQVNGASGNIATAVSVFQVYDQVIFGVGLQYNTHPDHNNTVNIVSQLNSLNVSVYGEVDCSQPFTLVKQDINKWQTLAIKGFYCNKMGYDFNVNRSTQNQILTYIHNKGLPAFVNTSNPDDIFSSVVNPTYNPSGLASGMTSNDWYLDQSYQIVNGAYQTVSDWTTKANKMANYKQSFGTKMACITTYDTSVFNQSKMDYSYFSAILYGFDSFGFGEYNFSTGSNSLPFRTRKTFYGTRLDGSILNTGAVYERKTNVGIHIDTSAHTINILLN